MVHNNILQFRTVFQVKYIIKQNMHHYYNRTMTDFHGKSNHIYNSISPSFLTSKNETETAISPTRFFYVKIQSYFIERRFRILNEGNCYNTQCEIHPY